MTLKEKLKTSRSVFHSQNKQPETYDTFHASFIFLSLAPCASIRIEKPTSHFAKCAYTFRTERDFTALFLTPKIDRCEAAASPHGGQAPPSPEPSELSDYHHAFPEPGTQNARSDVSNHRHYNPNTDRRHPRWSHRLRPLSYVPQLYPPVHPPVQRKGGGTGKQVWTVAEPLSIPNESATLFSFLLVCSICLKKTRQSLSLYV